MQTHLQPFRLSLPGLWLLLLATTLSAQSDEVFTLTADTLRPGRTVLLSRLVWKYRPGDDLAWVDAGLDDRAWETIAGTAVGPESQPKSGWSGIGWFRLHLRVDPLLADVALNLEMIHRGASEVYLDGKPVARFGKVSGEKAGEVAFDPNATPLGIVFGSASEHVIAVRYSNQQVSDLNRGWGRLMANKNLGAGFWAQLRRFDDSTNNSHGGPFSFTYDIFQGSVYLSFGLLHLLLFSFYPRRRDNLFYSLFLIGGSLNNFFMALMMSGHFGMKGHYFLDLANQLVGVPSFLALLLFIYRAFYPRIPRYVWLFAAACLAGLILSNLSPGRLSFWVSQSTLAALLVESDRVMLRAMLKRMEGALFIGAGVLLYSLLGVREFFLPVLQAQIPASWHIALDAVANYGLVLSISIYLAREFARTSNDLEAQLRQVKALSAKELEMGRREAEIRLQHEQEKARRALLEAENERKSRELEEARQLQLSMLPRSVPQLPGLEVAAYMKTASEVGGDYYDFHLAEDGTLTVAVGDATGHGLKAGTLVSSVKSLFIALADHPDIPHIFHRTSGVLRAMKLRSLFMAMTMVRVKGHRLAVGIAGMPALLICRAASGEVEEVALRGMPLGSAANYPYRQEEVSLSAGDVVVLMSDGLPERFNEQSEMFDEARTKMVLAEAAGKSPAEIIAHFVRAGDEWAGGRPQDDDVTFVVLKVKDNAVTREQ
ncbi:MAG TPA: SpoIIE family protein phosphatase [Blastocatellia bacterium]|nr:SpoIIE family protein phosphatase [Blastocatellia bacterium]